MQTSGPIGFGLVTYRPGGRIWPRWQSNYQLVIVHQGTMRVDIDRQSRHCRAGEGILLGPGHEEQFFFSKKGETIHSWCQAPPEAFPITFGFSPAMIAQPAACKEGLVDFMHMGLKIPAHVSRSPETQKSTIAAVIYAMWYFCSGLPTTESASQPLPEPLYKAWMAMQYRLAEPLPLDELARISGVSKGYLIRLAREHWDTTPSEYLWRLRIEEASRLLRETGLSISEVAYRTGFANPFHFSRRFRQYFQQDPSAWRNKEWGTPTKKN